MAKAAREQTVTVDGRMVKLTNLDKVLYPETGTTKADVLAYYAAVGPTMLPHLHRATGHPQALAGRGRRPARRQGADRLLRQGPGARARRTG